MDDLIARLRALSRHEHSDYSIGDEAADALEAAREDAANMATDAMLLRQDAERYRWLRDEAARYKGDDPAGGLVVSVTYNPRRADGAGFTGILKTPRDDDFDAAIDAEREARNG